LIPKQLFRISREVSDDVLSVFWSENKFSLHGAGVDELLQLGNPITWSSLRYLDVTLNNMSASTLVGDWETSKCLDSWRQVCANLEVHLPPSQLTLHFDICECGPPRAPLAKSALDSMLNCLCWNK
jgi:hypothetical protein